MAPLYRIGLGNDIHRLAAGKALVIGGVRIEHDKGTDAHSDGDVLLHATVDALLGAAALGDIGELFPDTDPAFKDLDSAVFLKKALDMVREQGWRLVNLDATVMAQAPKLKPHKLAIRENLASLLHVPLDAVNVKAKTGERVGPVGEELAIAAEVVVLIEKGGRAS